MNLAGRSRRFSPKREGLLPAYLQVSESDSTLFTLRGSELSMFDVSEVRLESTPSREPLPSRACFLSRKKEVISSPEVLRNLR
jgi:hypothetical protein